MRIDEICKVFTDGDWIESKDQSDRGIRLVQTGNVGEGKFIEKDGKEKYISEETFERLKCTEIFPGDILISRLPNPVGRGCIIPNKSERMITAVDCTICRVDETIVDRDFFCYFLQSPSYYNQLEQSVTGTTRKRISRKNLGSVDISIPSKEEQGNVVSVLDKVSAIIDARQQELQKLDELVKARFVEMFGDLANPECKWDRIRLVEACADKDDIKCGPFGTQLGKDEYTAEGVAVWEIPQINSGFKSTPSHFITQEKAEQLNAYSLLPGDIAMSRKGNVGKCALFPDRFTPGIIHSDVLRIRVDSARVDPVFMMSQLHYSRAVTQQIDLVSNGAIMAGVNVTKLKQIYVHLPPLVLQQQFGIFVAQVDKSKVVYARRY